MIIFGSGGDALNLGSVETRYCETCEKDRSFNLILHYQYWGLYWIFNVVTRKKYMLLCDVCQRGWELETSEVEHQLTKSPIPRMHRFGCLILIGLVALLILFGILSEQ